MEKTLQELADLLQGSIIQGDPSLKLTGGSRPYGNFLCRTALFGTGR